MSTVRPFGMRIRELRNQRNLAQMELAKLVGCSTRWLEKMESGQPADMLQLEKIARFFGCAVEELVRDSPTGDEVLGHEWNVDAMVRKEKPRVAANGLQYEVFRIPSRSLPGRFARAKLYNLASVSQETKKRTKSILQRHALICHQLHHVPGLARHITSTADVAEGFWWVLDEWSDGDTLYSLFEQRPTDAALRQIGVQLLDALSKLHEHGIIRRELAPRSVVASVEEDRVSVVLTDFETGKLLEGVPTVSPANRKRWQQNQFQSPEVVAGGDVDERSDWYSWGMIMAHGFVGTNDKEVAMEGLATLASPLRSLINSCISLSPSDRPKSSKTIMREFKKWKGASQ